MAETSPIKPPKGILRRRFQAPALPNAYIRESDISALVADVGTWRVCLVEGPAGYGKTQLMAQWYRDFSQKSTCCPLWFTLGEGNEGAASFIRGLAFLFRSIGEPFFLLSADFEDRNDAEGMLVDLINLFDELADPHTTYVLLFDEYSAASSPMLDKAMLFLNTNMPENVRFVLAGNYFSQNIDDMLLDSAVIEFRTPDLAMNDKRLERYVYGLMPDLDERHYRDMRRLFSRWPMAYAFAALARRRTPHRSDQMHLVKEYCLRYFDREVMEHIGEDARRFLVETSMLELLIPELCDHMTGRTESKGILEFLNSHNLSIHWEAEEGGYAHDPMFRQCLTEKLLTLPQSQIRALASRASEWYAGREMHNERVKYLAIASDPFFIEESVASFVGLTRGESSASLAEYLLNTPAERFEKNAFLIWTAVWSLISAGLIDEEAHWMPLVQGLGEQPHSKTAYAAAEALCLALSGDAAASNRIIDEILGKEAGLPRALQCFLIHMQGENYERLGQLKKSRDTYHKALSLAERVGGAFFKSFDLYLLSHQHVGLGDFDKAMELARRAIPDCSEESALFGEFHAIMAFVHIERGELATAETLLREAVLHGTRHANIDMYVDTQMTYARLQHARGNPNEAFRILSDVIQEVRGKSVPRNLNISAYALQARFALELGETSAVRECETAIDAFMDSSDLLRAVPCMLGKARILRADGKYDECTALMKRCKDKLALCNSRYLLAEYHLLRSTFYAEDGKDAQAVTALYKTLEIAMAAGYLTMFGSELPAIRECLLALAVKGKVSPAIRNYAKRILASFEPAEGHAIALPEEQVAHDGVRSLTEREREVLQMLNMGMSRLEIADALSLSQNTVKSHLKNIYAKLGAHTRSEVYRACQDAGDAGLLANEQDLED